MAWTAISFSAGETLTAAKMNQLDDNVDHLGSFGVGGTALSAIASPLTKLSFIHLGTYTGNGSATQAITGVGFQPRVLHIYPETANVDIWKTENDGTQARISTPLYENDHIISLDSGGFTVGDGTGAAGGNAANVTSRVYNYVCWR